MGQPSFPTHGLRYRRLARATSTNCLYCVIRFGWNGGRGFCARAKPIGSRRIASTATGGNAMLTPIIRRLIVGAAALVASALIAGPGVRAEDQDHRLYGAGERPARTVQAGVRDRESRRGDRLGPRLDRRRSRQRSSRKRTIRAPTSSGASARPRSRCSTRWGLLEPYTPKGADQLKPAFHEREDSHDLDRHGRVARGHVLQHGRRRQEEPAEARVVGGSRQPGLQGLDRDAQSRLRRAPAIRRSTRGSS